MGKDIFSWVFFSHPYSYDTFFWIWQVALQNFTRQIRIWKDFMVNRDVCFSKYKGLYLQMNWRLIDFIYFKSLFLRERERQRERMCAPVQAREGQREKQTEDPKWALCWPQRAWCGASIHNLETMTWAEIKSRMLSQLNHPGASELTL